MSGGGGQDAKLFARVRSLLLYPYIHYHTSAHLERHIRPWSAAFVEVLPYHLI